jgi:hypothetical protein
MQNIFKIFKLHIFTLTAIIGALIYFASCSENPTEPEDIELPESDLNYTEHISPVFVIRCGRGSGCHSGINPARGLDLTNYQNLINHFIDGSEPLIIIGDGENSFLYNILLGPISGRSRMPKDEAPLSGNNIIGIRTWIDEGAPEFP